MRLKEKISVLVLVAFIARTEASCFGKDASFNPATAKPTVSQPSRNDATKVMVDWSRILKNEKCVDKFSLLVWPDGMDKSSANKYTVDKTIMSKVVDVQPCVGYNFLVQIGEDNTFGNKVVPSGVATFKTTAATVNVNLDSSRFEVTYHWDPVKMVVDLRQASIKFPRDLLPGVSCLDYIQVTGEQVRSRTGPPLSPGGRSRTFSWSHLGQSSSSYNPLIQAGAAATLPAQINSGPSYANVAKSPGARGPLASQWSTSSSSSSSSTSSASTTSQRSQSKPEYANTLPRPSGGASKKVGPIKVQPPFLKPVIEILVAVEDCTEYQFELKMFAPGSKEISRVSQLKLPPLADIPGYVPPPLTSVMSITYNAQGKPVYGVKTTSGVNAACLPAYYEAYDAYTHRLENEVGWQVGEGTRVQNLITSTKETLLKSQGDMLKSHGCVCTSPHIVFSSTDASLLQKYQAQFGTYAFEGMHNQRPYYALSQQQPQTTSSLRSGSSTQTTTPKPASATFVPWYLFWDENEKQWVFGDKLGSTAKTEFGSVERSPATCPGDPPAQGNWQYKSSVLRRWKKNGDLKVTCGRV